MRNSTALSIALVVLFGFIGRASLLEYVELVDPTEARYAVIAQEMLHSGNWAVPMLPMPEGEVPYLGKPPLYFWLTALSYAVFGVDEWSSRLVSFFSTIGLAIAIFFFARRSFGWIAAYSATVIFISSVMVFLLAGANVTDVTLTLLVTCSVGQLYLFASDNDASRRRGIYAALFAALAFLVKGPVALALIAAPLMLWSAVRRDLAWLKRFPWVLGTLSFLALTAPWFIYSEIANPGFSKYFFWNENIARYLFKNYGDRYGSGHVHPYGAAWLMLFVAFIPWTFFGAALFFKRARVASRSLFSTNSTALFLLCWSASTPLFFTFVRQLHAMYIYPALPPLAMLAGVLLSTEGLIPARFRIKPTKTQLVIVLGLIAITALVLGAALRFSLVSIILTLTFVMGAFVALHALAIREGSLQPIAHLSLIMICAYLVFVSNLTPFINMQRSADDSLQLISEMKPCDGDSVHRVGISSHNTFSHYWTARNWRIELDSEVQVEYVDPERAEASHVCHFLVRSSKLERVPAEIREHFHLVQRAGDWWIFSREAHA